MSHLSIERLAALADEQPTADEHAHLAVCAACAQEIDAHRSLLAMAGSERDTLGIPLTRWESLAQRLRTEGLIAGDYGNDQPGDVTAEWVAAPVGRALSRKSWMRFAAAIMLVASGALIGRASMGGSLLPGGFTGVESQTAQTGSDSAPAFASIEDAERAKELYAAGYRRAVSYLAVQDSAAGTAETPAAMRARLAALDQVSRTIRQALQTAPFDPVINDFYLNSFGQREATLRQLNTVLPQNVRLNSY